MIKNVIVWLLCFLFEIGLAFLAARKEEVFRLDPKKYGVLLAAGNLLLMVLAMYREYRGGASAVWYFGLWSYLFCLSVYDLKYRELPDWWHLLPVAGYGLLQLLGEQHVAWQRSVLVMLVMGAVLGLVALIRRDAMGGGDRKLLVLCGGYAGTACFRFVFWGMAVAFVFSLLLLLLKKTTMKGELPFAPFLLVGALLI